MKSDNVASEREEYVGEEEDEEYEPVVNLDDLQEKLATLETTLEHNDNVLPDEFVIQLMRQFLASNICQNQGYVLDAYPKTMSQVNSNSACFYNVLIAMLLLVCGIIWSGTKRSP